MGFHTYLHIGVEHELNVKKWAINFHFDCIGITRYFLLLLKTQILVGTYLPSIYILYAIWSQQTLRRVYIVLLDIIKYLTYTHNKQTTPLLLLVYETTGGIEAPKLYTQPLRINKLSEFKNTLNN